MTSGEIRCPVGPAGLTVSWVLTPLASPSGSQVVSDLPLLEEAEHLSSLFRMNVTCQSVWTSSLPPSGAQLGVTVAALQPQAQLDYNSQHSVLLGTTIPRIPCCWGPQFPTSYAVRDHTAQHLILLGTTIPSILWY